jgi:hypothetical protein
MSTVCGESYQPLPGRRSEPFVQRYEVDARQVLKSTRPADQYIPAFSLPESPDFGVFTPKK